MNEEEILKKIQALGMFSHPASLERMKKVMAVLGNPEQKFSAIHVAGTNGKGSTATMLSSVLRATGRKTGLLISPFVVTFRERIQVNGEFIDPESLCRLTERVLNTGIALTEFECITAVGFLFFAEQHCEIAVIEVGLGGRLDATNVLPSPMVSVITKIGLDHTAILGDTLEKICKEKCGIIKNNPVVSSCCQAPSALAVIESCTRQLTVPDVSQLSVLKSDWTGNDFCYRGEVYHTELRGRFQIENALNVIETVHLLNFKVPQSTLQKGIASAFFPARLECFSGTPPVFVDGAHNPDGAAALAQFLQTAPRKIVAVVGMMRDKDVNSVLRQTLPFFEQVFVVRATDSPRALRAEELAGTARKFCEKTVVSDNLQSALQSAKNVPQCEAVFVFGSLYLASAVRPLLQKN